MTRLTRLKRRWRALLARPQPAPVHDRLRRGERLALAVLVAGQILNIFVWYLGKADLAATVGGMLPWIRLVFAVLASAALDLVVVTTTIGRRDGRRSLWGWATILAAAFFSAAIALDVAGGPSLGAWLHACYAINIFLFAQHVAHPRARPSARPRQLRALIRRLARQLRTARAELRDRAATVTQLTERAAQPEREIAQLRAELATQGSELARLREAAAQPLTLDGADLLAIGRRLRELGVSSREAAQLVGMSESTLRSRLERAAQNGVHAPS